MRRDGYHLLESLFVPLDLADHIELTLRSEPGVVLSLAGEAEGVPSDSRNLAHRAAAAFVDAAACGGGVAIRLQKRIPASAGIGGGSSDAAAVLRGLRELLPGRVDDAALAELALRLGADVPFFLEPRPALIEGIGERITPVAGVPSFPVVLAHPGLPLATPAVFAAYDAEPAAALTAPAHAPTIRALLALREGRPVAHTALFAAPTADQLQPLLVNALEPAARRLCPAVAKLREELEATEALAVGLSGSGPTVFGVYAGLAAARLAAAQLTKHGVRNWLARSTASPEPASP